MTHIESIYPELSFDTKIVWLGGGGGGGFVVLKFCQETSKKHDFWTIVHAESGRL